MNELVAALVALAFLALLLCVVLLVRRAQAEQRATGEALHEHIHLSAHALAAQLMADRDEQRRHLDATATALLAQLAPRRARPTPLVEVRPAPPLAWTDDEGTWPAGCTPRSHPPPSGAVERGAAPSGPAQRGRLLHLAILIADVIDRAARIHAPGSFAVCLLDLADEHALRFAALLHHASPAGSDPLAREPEPMRDGRSFLTRAATIELMAHVSGLVLGDEIADAVKTTHAARRVPVVVVSAERAYVRAFPPSEAS